MESKSEEIVATLEQIFGRGEVGVVIGVESFGLGKYVEQVYICAIKMG